MVTLFVRLEHEGFYQEGCGAAKLQPLCIGQLPFRKGAREARPNWCELRPANQVGPDRASACRGTLREKDPGKLLSSSSVTTQER